MWLCITILTYIIVGTDNIKCEKRMDIKTKTKAEIVYTKIKLQLPTVQYNKGQQARWITSRKG